MKKPQIGLIGLGVMGSNLARNIANHKFGINIYNRSSDKTDEFIKQFGNEYLGKAHEMKELIRQIERPRKMIIMVKAGEPVDAVIKEISPLMDEGDIIMDCGNSHFKDSIRRGKALQQKGIDFIGCGISGGEEGALYGPSLMPSGKKEAYDKISDMLKAIAARDFQGDACVSYIGEDGSGHYVKMIHNGIEYGIMQLMAETYELLRSIYALKAPDIAKIFQKFNKGKLQSYLFEIAGEVLLKKDEFKKGYLIDFILDSAEQTGTGLWTVIDAIERKVGVPTIAEAVFARIISSQKEKRMSLSQHYSPLKKSAEKMPEGKFVKLLEDALYAGMLSTYAQGYDLIRKASEDQNWDINFAEISRIWEGGCIIRADMLHFLYKAYKKAGSKKTHVFEIPDGIKGMKETAPKLKEIIKYAYANETVVPGLASAYNYFANMTAKEVPANFVQGLRDYFGAHTYKRKDREGKFHTTWKS